MVNHPNRGKGPHRSPSPEEIRAAREAAGLTREEAAKLISGSTRAWINWEQPKDSPEHRPMHAGLWKLFQIELKRLK